MIDMAEDRDQFNAMMQKLEIPMPESGMAVNIEEALEIAHRIGYPMMVRPSYVLGGRGMEVVYDDDMLKDYMAAAINVTPERPILMGQVPSKRLGMRDRRYFRQLPRLCSYGYAAYRTGRHPLRRFRLCDPFCGDFRRTQGPDPEIYYGYCL